MSNNIGMWGWGFAFWHPCTFVTMVPHPLNMVNQISAYSSILSKEEGEPEYSIESHAYDKIHPVT
jgi:hypothetical protein